jgi:hypothetical protein
VQSCPRCAAEYHADRAETLRRAALTTAWLEWIAKYPDESGVNWDKVPKCDPVFQRFGL